MIFLYESLKQIAEYFSAKRNYDLAISQLHPGKKIMNVFQLNL